MTTVGFFVKLNYICGINEEWYHLLLIICKQYGPPESRANVVSGITKSASSMFIIIDGEGKMLVVAIFILTTNLKGLATRS